MAAIAAKRIFQRLHSGAGAVVMNCRATSGARPMCSISSWISAHIVICIATAAVSSSGSHIRTGLVIEQPELLSRCGRRRAYSGRRSQQRTTPLATFRSPRRNYLASVCGEISISLQDGFRRAGIHLPIAKRRQRTLLLSRDRLGNEASAWSASIPYSGSPIEATPPWVEDPLTR